MVHIWDLKPGLPRQTKRPATAVSANGLTVEEILARNMQAMAALQSMQITMTIDTMEPRQSGNAMPTAWRAMTVTASLSLPKGAQDGLAASGVTHQRVVLADGQIVTQTYKMNPWKNQLPQTPVSPQHDHLALSQVGRFARMPEFMGTTSLDGHETYALKFAVSNDTNSINNNRTHCIYEDKSGRFWVGTGEGLNLFDRKNEIFTRFYFRDGDSNSHSTSTSNQYNLGINAITEDPVTGDLLMGTERDGLWRFSVKEKIFSKYKFNSENNFDKKIGSIQSFYKARDGKIWSFVQHIIKS